MREAACPVIVLLHAPDLAFVKEASKQGVFAHIIDADANDGQSSIDIVLHGLAEYHDLEGAFGCHALTERAKGILMERHSVDEATARRRQARRSARWPARLGLEREAERRASAKLTSRPLRSS